MGLPPLDDRFPRYTQYDPAVPVWCITPGRGGAIHRFFDTSPISPSGRYVAVFRLPFEDRLPTPGEKGEVCVIDLTSGEDRVVAQTAGWEPQMGANIGWGGSDESLLFNDVDEQTWRPFALKLNPLTGKGERMDGTLYQASHDGRWLISANMTTMRRTQRGYGVVVPDEHVRTNIGLAEDDGFFITDTQTGKCRLLISLKDVVARANAPAELLDAGRFEVYGFHSKWNEQDDRLMVTLRWFPQAGGQRFAVHDQHKGEVRYAVYTLRPDGSDVHLAIGPEQWEKGGHHTTFTPDGRRLSANLNIDRDGLYFVQCDLDGKNLRRIHPTIPGSGHPTVHPDGRHILTDTYTQEKTAYGDGTIPLRWIDYVAGTEQRLVRINTAQPCRESPMRVDPHPAWDRTWQYVAFNGFVEGTRRVYIADMRGVTGPRRA